MLKKLKLSIVASNLPQSNTSILYFTRLIIKKNDHVVNSRFFVVNGYFLMERMTSAPPILGFEILKPP